MGSPRFEKASGKGRWKQNMIIKCHQGWYLSLFVFAEMNGPFLITMAVLKMAEYPAYIYIYNSSAIRFLKRMAQKMFYL